MANQQGFQSSAAGGGCGKIFDHYDRSKYEKYPNLTQRGSAKRTNYSDIDQGRTHLNYNLGPERGMTQQEFFEKRLGEVYVHKSALKNAMVDWVVTLPNLPQYRGREREFFETCYAALEGMYGRENVISAYVHMDETTPHMHFAFLPIAPDRKHEQGWKLSRKAVNTVTYVNGQGRKVTNSAGFSTYVHGMLDRAVCDAMGFERSGIELTEEERSRKKQGKWEQTLPEYKEAQKAVRDMEKSRTDLLMDVWSLGEDAKGKRREIEGLDASIARASEDLAAAVEEAEQARAMEREALERLERHRQREEEIGAELLELGEREAGLASEVRELGMLAERLGRAVEAARVAIDAAAADIRRRVRERLRNFHGGKPMDKDGYLALNRETALSLVGTVRAEKACIDPYGVMRTRVVDVKREMGKKWEFAEMDVDALQRPRLLPVPARQRARTR